MWQSATAVWFPNPELIHGFDERVKKVTVKWSKDDDDALIVCSTSEDIQEKDLTSQNPLYPALTDNPRSCGAKDALYRGQRRRQVHNYKLERGRSRSVKRFPRRVRKGHH
jgi:hypothetical protein